ncbi:hypothetical protein MKY04_18195 [Lysinibacillus telephonicus]|uniref:hypothetical protein n=1 Tax=Lysinibacillus telephonicus TaxID=1714840 RepID=UPI0031FE067B
MLTFSVNDCLDYETKEEVLRKIDENRNIKTPEVMLALSEMYIKSVEGKLESTENIAAFGKAIERNNRLAKQKREISILTEEDLKQGFSGISEAALVAEVDYTKIEEDIDIVDEIVQFREVVQNLLIIEGVNLNKIIQLSLTCDFVAQDRLKDIISKFELHELVKAILRNVEAVEILGLNKLVKQEAKTNQEIYGLYDLSEREITAKYENMRCENYA